MGRCKLFHGCHLDEIFQLIVEFKVSFPYSDFCNFDSLIIMLDSRNDIIIICQLYSEIGNLILSDGLLEWQRIHLYSSREDEYLGNEYDIGSTESRHVDKSVFSRLKGFH
jgi:hypothetical protein